MAKARRPRERSETRKSTIRLSVELYQSLEQMADDQKWSVNSILEAAAEQYVRNAGVVPSKGLVR